MGVVIALAGKADASALAARGPLPAAVRLTPLPPRPWAWLPEEVAWYGIANDADAPRIWFVGDPLGLEWGAFEATVRAVERQDGGLSPLARDTVRRLRHPPPVAVLTVPS
jgi:hypothetical protein